MAIPPAIQNMMLSLGVMQLGRKVPFDNPQVLQGFRVLWIAVQLAVIGVYYFTGNKIKAKNDTTMLKYVEPKMPGSQDPPKVVTTTNRDYDLQQISSAIRGVFMGILMTGAIHLYFKTNPPLFIQSVMPLKGLYDAKILQIHLRGMPATGDLKRPFKAPAMFGMEPPQADAATVKKLEEKPALSRKDE